MKTRRTEPATSDADKVPRLPSPSPSLPPALHLTFQIAAHLLHLLLVEGDGEEVELNQHWG